METIAQKRANQKYHRSKRGKISNIYDAQIRLSKERNHPAPTYSKKELTKWCLKQSLYHSLYEVWKNSGYNRALAPSVDRKNDKKSYLFGNIQLMTTYQNVLKGRDEIGSKKRRKIIQIEIVKAERIVRVWPSVLEASRGIGQKQSAGIHRALDSGGTAGGFKWKYAK